MKKIIFFISLIFVMQACENKNSTEATINPTEAVANVEKKINYNIVGAYKHDTASFTEGLEFYKGNLYESGGDFGTSLLQFGNARTGQIQVKNKMSSPTIFAEGITILNGKLYQLTYKTNEVFVYNVNDVTKVIEKYTWPLEGWGMTNNGSQLIISTGSSDLFFVDPATFKVKSTIHVHDNAGPVDSINELEFVNGFIYSNIYETYDIIKINAETGEIVGRMTLNNLLQPIDIIPGRTDVLNGIAYDSVANTFFITGKRWPKIFEIKLN